MNESKSSSILCILFGSEIAFTVNFKANLHCDLSLKHHLGSFEASFAEIDGCGLKISFSISVSSIS